MTLKGPQLITTVAELRARLSGVRQSGQRIGLVPTMGALHDGHASLVRASENACDFTVVTIFVNPAQFAPGEDLASYPRTLDDDLRLLAECGADVVFAPSKEDVYNEEFDTWVEVGAIARTLEGVCRPHHFRGVATVVLKLFNMVGADVAFFGQKDYQQTLVIRRMVTDLDVPIEICVCPIVREADGLAMSSRNAYLSPASRKKALVLSKSLQLAAKLLADGERDVEALTDRIEATILTAEGAEIDYIALVDPETLEPVEKISGPTLVALAVVIDGTRLIDNCILG